MTIELAKEGQIIQVLPLCQSRSVLLRPGTVYRFYVHEVCQVCHSLNSQATKEYDEQDD